MKKTITALATPPGIGGIAVIRISGDKAFEISDKAFAGKVRLTDAKSHTIHYGEIRYKRKLIDTVTASVFREPNSYTGENVIEFGCHGGNIVAGEIIDALIDLGAEPAEPGEFTRRAFLNGKLDLAQVEAVADIIHSSSKAGAQTAARQLSGEFTNRLAEFRKQLMDISGLLELELDFADEDLEFLDRDDIRKKIFDAKDFCLELAESFKSAEVLRSGYFVGIAGFPNSGKSTLFNTLLKRKRAIVSDVPGTTRDYLEETVHLGGIAVRFIDTAGIRETGDIIEIEGIKFAESLLEQANMILVLNDISISPGNSDSLIAKLRKKFPETESVMVQNKIDKIENAYSSIYNNNDNAFFISAKSGNGIDALKKYITKQAVASTDRIKDVLVNQRQSLLLKRAADDLQRAIEGIDAEMENELIAIDIRRASQALGELTGESWSEEVLNNIFSHFCIGK